MKTRWLELSKLCPPHGTGIVRRQLTPLDSLLHYCDDGDLDGILIFYPHSFIPVTAGTAFMIVRPDRRKRGVGTALLNAEPWGIDLAAQTYSNDGRKFLAGWKENRGLNQ